MEQRNMRFQVIAVFWEILATELCKILMRGLIQQNSNNKRLRFHERI